MIAATWNNLLSVRRQYKKAGEYPSLHTAQELFQYQAQRRLELRKLNTGMV
jgi:hypothetical protein